ncbi:DNA-binding response regulator [Enterococcus faecalis]|uniref:LytTR family transcriptional regulator DNA-binding domain-containing protein n=1 Tax=Enterococcus faecalis TaxID=1351 RepID=UPI00235F1098|nr:DNA-binding response regulator [Enterococcus faecalis]MDD0851220.1 DNA-binding response regulator [Enterococcus faecalis]
MSYPVIVCEDNHVQLNQIQTIIKDFNLFHNDLFKLSLKTTNPIEVECFLRNVRPTKGIYILDINLNHSVNGIDLAEKIRTQDVESKIIFITTHEEMMPLTIQRRVETLGFVTKDQDFESYRAEIVELLVLAQKRIDASRNLTNQAFVFSIGSQTFTLDLQEIYFLESSELPHRVILHTQNGQYEFYDKLTNLESQYPTLLRISRSCLANPLNMREVNFKTRTITFSSDLIRTFSLSKATLIKKKLKQQNL